MIQNNLITYIFICFIAAISPGPGMLALIHHSMNYGLKKSIPLIMGMQIGLLIAAIIAASGIGIVITSSPKFFFVLKIAGSMYVLYLGVKIIFNSLKSRSNVFSDMVVKKNHSFIVGILIAVANPKTIVFFLAILPQFTNNTQSFLYQMITLILLLMFTTLLVHIFYGTTAQAASLYVYKYMKYINLITGCFFILLSILFFN